ncbi:MAG: hypothetical protein MZW92_33000 [Comamonadaceae bacterium]|nr:hypothetical protein [Comamonadaceae bacterium]
MVRDRAAAAAQAALRSSAALAALAVRRGAGGCYGMPASLSATADVETTSRCLHRRRRLRDRAVGGARRRLLRGRATRWPRGAAWPEPGGRGDDHADARDRWPRGSWRCSPGRRSTRRWGSPASRSSVLAGIPGIVIPQKVAMAANSFPLLAAPLFILMGNLMNAVGHHATASSTSRRRSSAGCAAGSRTPTSSAA